MEDQAVFSVLEHQENWQLLHPQLCWHHTGGALGDALHAGDADAAFLSVSLLHTRCVQNRRSPFPRKRTFRRSMLFQSFSGTLYIPFCVGPSPTQMVLLAR